MKERDTRLDLYHGWTMIYILCVIHVMYWLHLGKEPLMSLALIEMPVIFFISGAAMSMGGGGRSFLAVLWNRARRVMLPFYIYAMVSLVLLCAMTLIWNIFHEQIERITGMEAAGGRFFNITGYGWREWAAIVSCRDIPGIPLVWHIWFIVPYMFITCSLGIQAQAVKLFNRGGYLSLCIILFLLSLLTDVELIREIAGYNIFFMSGYLFYKNISRRMMLAAGIGAAATIAALTAAGCGFVPMQAHKFPPDALFIAYGMLMLVVSGFVLKRLRLPASRLVLLWNRRGYTIYLYQNFVFIAVFALHKVLISKLECAWAEAVVCSMLVLAGSTALSFITCPFEDFIMKRLRRS